ncbi:hypothetical protein [Gemmatimonas sp.]|jgi:hypothetical protein|uniref:hypothetical protein n=1 Tax=Gemmatimonas sp. TaxID=1962908 RepID=UPI0037BF51DF
MSTDRHLRPDEIELLLDGEEGFGVAPLRAHARSCLECQAELESARELMFALDTLPDFAPSPAFADRVMSQVQVFEPWHVAATRAVEQFVPATRSARLAAGLGAAVTAGLATAGATWAVARADMGFVLALLGLESFREQVVAAGSDLLTTVVGQPGLEALRGSTPEVMALALGGFVAVAGMGVVGIRALATSSRSAR